MSVNNWPIIRHWVEVKLNVKLFLSYQVDSMLITDTKQERMKREEFARRSLDKIEIQRRGERTEQREKKKRKEEGNKKRKRKRGRAKS